MRIISTKDYLDMSRKAANLISAYVLLKPHCVLGLATGSSPIGIYEQLVQWHRKGDIDFKDVTTFNLDEYRGLPRSNAQSYYHFMHDILFNHINVCEERVHIPNGENLDATQECANYEKLIVKAGGIDMQLLGMGPNGHIGFNEPADTFPVATHCVDLTPATIEANKRFFASADDVPRQAYTMGIGTIMSARKILISISGASKADIVRDAFFGPVTPRVPASVLQLHTDVTVVADEAAFSKCKL